MNPNDPASRMTGTPPLPEVPGMSAETPADPAHVRSSLSMPSIVWDPAIGFVPPVSPTLPDGVQLPPAAQPRTRRFQRPQ
jgi:hypothetical protein